MSDDEPEMSVSDWLVIALLMLCGPPAAYTAFILSPTQLWIGIFAVILSLEIIIKLLFVYGEPFRERESDTFVAPAEGQRIELEGLSVNAGLSSRRIWISSELKRFMPAIVLGSLPFNRHLVVDETFFTEYTPEEREAIIVYETYLAKRYYNTLTAMTFSLPLMSYFIVVDVLELYWIGQIGPWLFAIGAICSIVIYHWSVRRLVYRAIDRAVAQTDPNTVESVVEKASQREDKTRENLEVNAMDKLIYPEPSQRINHLR